MFSEVGNVQNQSQSNATESISSGLGVKSLRLCEVRGKDQATKVNRRTCKGLATVTQEERFDRSADVLFDHDEEPRAAEEV